jgi:hypothetical protein
MKKILGIVLLLAAIGFLAYFLINSNKTNKQSQVDAGWKSTSLDAGSSMLTISYPPNWTVAQTPGRSDRLTLVSDIPLEQPSGNGIFNEHIEVGGKYVCVNGLAKSGDAGPYTDSKCTLVEGVPFVTFSQNQTVLETYSQIISSVK